MSKRTIINDIRHCQCPLAFHSIVCPHMALQIAASRTVMSATGILEKGMEGTPKRNEFASTTFKLDLLVKGTVRRKLMWVKSGINP